MRVVYENSLKKKIVKLIVECGAPTKRTAEGYNIPLKTLEKWITAYNKNNHCFDDYEEEDNIIYS